MNHRIRAYLLADSTKGLIDCAYSQKHMALLQQTRRNDGSKVVDLIRADPVNELIIDIICEISESAPGSLGAILGLIEIARKKSYVV